MATQRSPLVMNAGKLQQLQAADSLLLPPFDFRNRLTNGSFVHWQRGESRTFDFGTGTVGYTADRWATQYNGTGATRTLARIDIDADIPPSNYGSAVRIHQSVAPTGQTTNRFFQRIEYVTTLSGKDVCFSFWAKAAVAHDITVVMAQVFGTGGSPHAEVDYGPTTISLTTGWVRYSVTFTLATTFNLTQGSNGDSYLLLQMTFPVNTTHDTYITGCQLEEGQAPSELERLPSAINSFMCLRYYNTTYGFTGKLPGDVAQIAYINHRMNQFTSLANRIATLQWKFPVPMRATPSITTYSNATGASGKIRITGVDYTSSVDEVDRHGVVISGTDTATESDWNGVVHIVADAEL
jgi:hypothetical protein